MYLKLNAHIWVHSVGRGMLFFFLLYSYSYIFAFLTNSYENPPGASKNSNKPQQSIATVFKSNVFLLWPPLPASVCSYHILNLPE